ncbi:MAG: IclR family transcriptional regulator [Chloroflexi bacterium]|nr:IclR family transcriptional regulator [Chloroflexota bacterium]
MVNRVSHTETERDRSSYDVAVLGKALDLLEALVGSNELGLSELCLRTDVNKTSAFRVLSTLESRGYVAKHPETRKYRPGPKLVALSSALVSGLNLVQCARPVLQALQAEFGETVNLGILSDGHVLYVDMLESRHGLRTAARVGSRDALHATALGKAMLAFLPTDRANRLLASLSLTAITPRTITSLDALERELALARQRGYAIDDQENETGARCVGVPILDSARRPGAAISVSGPAWRLADDLVGLIGARLIDAASEIERAMGYRTAGTGSRC